MAVEELFYQQRPRNDPLFGVTDGFAAVFGDDDALTRGEAVGFHHVGGAEFIDGADELVDVVALFAAAGGHIGPLHDVFCEGLRSFDRGGGLRRAEHRHPERTHRVAHPGHKRRFGADHHELELFFFDEVSDQLGVGDAHSDALSDVGHPRIAGADNNFVPALTVECGDDGVLTGA